MKKPHLQLVRPTTENRTVTPRRPKNAAVRTREHLTMEEVERLIEAAKDNRYGQRDALMILLTFRHGLRAAEVCDLRWEQVDFKTANLHVRRVKNGTPATHPLTGREMRALRKHQRDSERSPFVFVSERGAPLTAPGFSRMVERAAVAADLGIKASRAHAPSRLRLQAGERRRRYPLVAGLPRPPQHPEHDTIHRAGAGPVQRLLERLGRVPIYPACWVRFAQGPFCNLIATGMRTSRKVRIGPSSGHWHRSKKATSFDNGAQPVAQRAIRFSSPSPRF